MSKGSILWIVACVVTTTAASEPQEYIANFTQAKWYFAASKLECRLEHTIPGYGSLLFITPAGRQPEMRLHVKFDRFNAWSQGKFEFEGAPWATSNQHLPGWDFTFNTRINYVSFSGRQAYRTLNALVKGQMPKISHSDGAYSDNIIVAKVTPVQFKDAYEGYMQCLTDLIPVTFNDVIRSAVYFESASSHLNAETKQWLDYVIAFAQHLDARRIDIAGYTDSVGTFQANHRLSSARARNVKNYLVAQGIPEDKILARVFGEHRPIADNHTRQGRAINRRVTIRILP